MRAFLVTLWVQFKIDLRDKGTLLNYYLVPLAFFLAMGAVFSTVTPLMKDTLSATMSIFAITMGAVMGSPTALIKLRESNTLRAFKVNGISPSVILAVHAISAFVHLFIVSTIIYLLAPALYGAQLPVSALAYFGCITLYLLACIGIGMLIGVIAPGHSFATMLSMVLFLPSQLFSGIMFPTSMLPGGLHWIRFALPATYSLQSFYSLAYAMPFDIQPSLAISIIAAFAVVTFGVAIWRLNSLRKTEQY